MSVRVHVSKRGTKKTHDNPETKKITKIRWTKEEDNLLEEVIGNIGTSNWCLVAEMIPGRTGKQCRERYIVHINPSVNRESWTEDEDRTLIHFQSVFGNKWSLMTKFLPGRTTTIIKNRWKWFRHHPDHVEKIKSNHDELKLFPDEYQVQQEIENFEQKYFPVSLLNEIQEPGEVFDENYLYDVIQTDPFSECDFPWN